MEKAKVARRESKVIDFKETFDIESSRDWVEILKDLVAMANTGGGAILIGVKNNGDPADFDASHLLALDPAQITDKVAKYTGEQFSSFAIEEVLRSGREIAALFVSAIAVPIVFNREGTYTGDGGEQKFAFRKGTLYFRHGAKSEPAATNDLREFIERELERIRAAWLGGIRKVVEAPTGSVFEVVSPKAIGTAAKVHLTETGEGMPVQLLNPNVTHPYRLKETVEQVNKAIGGERKVNSYDIQSVRWVFGVDDNPNYFYGPKFGSPQYSDAFVAWVVKEYQSDASFFDSCRAKLR